MSLFEHKPHQHVANRAARGPIVRRRQQPGGYQRFNSRWGLRITNLVGSMTAAYVFGLLALISLPAAIVSGSALVIVAWIAQTFLQLVLLPVIIVGQNEQGEASDARAEQTFNDVEAILHSQDELARHLAAQDEVLTQLRNGLEKA